jgi:hypothetical protein
MLKGGRRRPSPAVMVAARQAVVGAGGGGRRVSVNANTVTLPDGAQLRLGRDSRWYRFEKRSGRWELAAPPAEEIEDLVVGLS